jgi:hypothetical protein
MSKFNTFTNHPLIDNSQDYTIEKKYVSIHSEDRNILKYPSSSDFEIELPQDYLNVSTVKLSSWSFPSNYNTFSLNNLNTLMTFSFLDIYNPASLIPESTLQNLIYQYLTTYKNNIGTSDFIVSISSGFYNPTQMATELTNRFNISVTNYLSYKLSLYDAANGTIYNTTFLNVSATGVIQGGYQEFVIVYNEVEQNLWFGNKSSTFTLTQNTQLILKEIQNSMCFSEQSVLPDDTLLGLPTYLGLSACNLNSKVVNSLLETRFYYGDVLTSGDDGYWLLLNSTLTGSTTSYIKAPYKLNNMGPSYFYIEIDSLNYIDETEPFNVSKETRTTNLTNGIVNSSFAKIAISSTPLSQYYDNCMDSYKYFNPPAERIRRLKIKLRYHNGMLVNFDTFPYSFTLEFTLFKPQIMRGMKLTSSYLN